MPVLPGYIRLAAAVLLARGRRNGEAGYTTETVVVIALLVAL